MLAIPTILVFAGSGRTGAYSGKLADVAQKALALQGAEVTRISLADYPLPIIDEDLERESGMPDNAVRLGRQIAAHPQECLRNDRASLLGQYGLAEGDALALEFGFGSATLASGESVRGAGRFASGTGRHGHFDRR